MIKPTQRYPRISTPIPLLLCLLILGGLAVTRPASAAPPSQVSTDLSCKPVDIVVLIDQSDSMNDNDPDGERFRAAQTIVRFLGNHAVWLCQGENIVHRISVIGFGDDPTQSANTQTQNPYQNDVSIYIEDQEIPPRPTFADWTQDRPAILDQLTQENKDYLGATDHVAGFQAARERLDIWRQNPLGDVPRRQSVIMITDGEPCLFAFGCPYQVTARDMDAIVDLTDPINPQFPWRGADHEDSVHMSLIAMSRRGSGLQFANIWQQIMQDHGGDIFNANDLNTNLSTIVTDIISPVAGSTLTPVECNEEIWIYPYVNNLVLLYAFNTDDQVTDLATITIETSTGQITVQGGTPSSPAVTIGDYTEDERNEFYVFQRPLPGRYRVSYTTDAAECDVRVGDRPVSGEVQVPAADAAFPATDPPSPIAAQKFRVAVFEAIGEVTIEGEMEDVELIPLEELEGYPLEVIATVNSEDGTHTQTYDFTQVENGIYESSQVIASPVVGDYNWEVVATVNNPNSDGEPIEVFRDSGGFSANEVTPFGFKIGRPLDGDVLPLNTVSGAQQVPVPISIAIDLVDANGDPAEVETYLNNDGDLFTASLLRGADVVETVPLTRTPGSPSEFAGQFSNSAGGDVLTPGDYTIEVNAAWTTDRYNPLLHQPATQRAAIGVSQFEVIPLELRVVPPEDTTVHEDNWLGALRGRVKPVDFYIEIVNAVTQEPVDLNQVLADTAASYQAAVVPPSGNPSVAPLTVLSNERFQRLVAEGAATDVAEEGEYQIKLDPSVIPLQDNFAWAGNETVATFAREDTTFTNPTIWRIIAGVLAVLVLAILAWIIYSLTGGPTGELALVPIGGSRTSDIAAFSLRSTPRVNRLRNSTLTSMGVKEIRVRRGPRDEDGLRTVYASATGVEGDGLLDNATMTENVNESFLPDAELVYRTR